nr:ribonuclease H-like domain-containing protein [Tanacetum cinerariifolium]
MAVAFTTSPSSITGPLANLAHPSSYYYAGPTLLLAAYSHLVAQPTYSMAQPNLPAPITHSTGTPQPKHVGPTPFSRQPTTLLRTFNTVSLQDLASGAWNMDTGASSHFNNLVTNLHDVFNTCMYPFISVGDSHSIPVTNTGHSILPTPTRSLHLNNVLITPYIVKNLIFVRQFVGDNNCTIEFDAFGFSVKDFLTRWVLFRCDSTGDLYPLAAPSPIPHALIVSQHTWHQRLRHLRGELEKHVRLPFVSSGTVISSCFDIFHSDVWTSPISSLSVPRPQDSNIQRCMRLFRYKYLADGTLSRYKARLVANGSTQMKGVDLDVKNAFLHGDLSETVYMHQPSGFQDYAHPDYKYAIEILEKAHMVSCNPSRTPVDTESKLGVDGDPVSDPTLYRSLTGSLQYLNFTRPDISYAVQQLFSSSTTDLVAYSDADWAGCPTTRRSTSGYCVFLGNNLLSWSAKRQPTLSRSSAKAEYRDVSNTVAETCWLRNLLLAAGQVRVLHVPSRCQFTDIFTKELPSVLFEEFRSSLSIRSLPAQTTREC